MRHASPQLPLTAPWIDHPHAHELAAMSALLDEQPDLARGVQQDLEQRCAKNPRTGHPGLTGDQTLRLLLLRQLTGWTYAELAFHVADSASYSAFARLGPLQSPPSKSALADNIRRVRPETLAALNDRLVTSPTARALEPARTVRMDATVVPVAIHHPTDSSLLWDAVRVLDRLLRQAESHAGFTAYHRHRRRAKRRALEIDHLAPQAVRQRTACYRELVRLTEATATYATCALAHLEGLPAAPPRTRLRTQLTRLLPRVAQVIDQTTRRVFHGEVVPADEKLVSLFEAHTDVLVKDRRETYYGHKIFLTTGRSGLILDCAIPKGNPADVTWTVPLVRRQRQLFGKAPRQVSFDGAFASQDNLAATKALGVEDVCFAKKRGLTIAAMVRSEWVYDKLRRFRAGIESGISLLKRVFGLARCVWKGALGFHAYVRAAVLAANLLVLARHRLA
ncbi:MAG TPA: ISNCY family transposase [Gemmatimonadales bacterium]|nr:ISNCY family transposase [Gemmatimonadales bacterium]